MKHDAVSRIVSSRFVTKETEYAFQEVLRTQANRYSPVQSGPILSPQENDHLINSVAWMWTVLYHSKQGTAYDRRAEWNDLWHLFRVHVCAYGVVSCRERACTSRFRPWQSSYKQKKSQGLSIVRKTVPKWENRDPAEGNGGPSWCLNAEPIAGVETPQTTVRRAAGSRGGT